MVKKIKLNQQELKETIMGNILDQTITIQTEEDKCGDEYLANGELKITLDEDYAGCMVMENGDGFKCVVSISDMKRAITKLEA